jgi:hypothetical protein
MKPITISGTDYVPRRWMDEALILIAAYSELYDMLAASPSEPTPIEKAAERELTRKWTALRAKVDRK